MAKTTHTGRGTCQVCGALQAIDNVTGITAKHGYKVAGYHFFVGVCPGARYLPAQKDLTITHKIIGDLTSQALAHDVMAERLLKFEVHNVIGPNTGHNVIRFEADAERLTSFQEWDYNLPVVRTDRWGRENKSRGGYVTVNVTADTPTYVVEREQTHAAKVEEVNARHARSHIKMMIEQIIPKLGTELLPGKAKARVWAVGDDVLVAGQVHKVERVNDAICEGCGPYLNGQYLPHVYFKRRLDGREIGIPARSARRPKTAE